MTLHSTGKQDEPGLTDEEFEDKYGPKPWDLVNDILARANLAYKIVPPTHENIKFPYELKLVDQTSELEIAVHNLSSGEKVLMALGLAIYRTQEGGEKPDLLLLDEPDAPLHPEFSDLLIDVLLNVVVKTASVRVLMTTHSPVTVAMSPEGAIFEMNREASIPEPIRKEDGVRILTAGIPHLRVSNEPRRQIFVESQYDVTFYERIFNALHAKKPFDYDPVFLQPHSGTSNCSDVQKITLDLQTSGNDLVRGVIDWDGENVAKAPVFVLGDGERYAIENYILDPLFIALALVKSNKLTFSDLGVEVQDGYLYVTSLTIKEAQALADTVCEKVGLSQKNAIDISLENGWIVQRPKDFLEMKGHDWEDILIKNIPELGALTRGDKTEAKLKGPVLNVIEDAPFLMPASFRSTLERLL